MSKETRQQSGENGGEPTRHPQFAELLAYAIGTGLAVEVYSNLTHVKDAWWQLLTRPDVCLATSYYSDLPAEHDAITGRPGSHARTLANIRQAVSLQIPVRAGIIAVRDGQRTAQARAELEALGVTRIRTDTVRSLGRAAALPAPDASQLCGKCGRGIAAILPSGDVCPCVMARWLIAGNVRQTPLADILSGPAMTTLAAAIPAPRAAGDCPPDHCNPDLDGNDCRPAESAPLVSLSPRAARERDCDPVTGGGCNPGNDQCGPNRAHQGGTE